MSSHVSSQSKFEQKSEESVLTKKNAAGAELRENV